MNEIVKHNGVLDPARLGFPPMFPVELAMNAAPLQDVCEAYGVTKDHFEDLIRDPLFVKAFADARESLAKDGMSFKVKAKLQAEELLKESWKLIHDTSIPASVRADLIKSTVRWAEYEPKPSQNSGITGNAFQININL
jgi:hypothetical protein